MDVNSKTFAFEDKDFPFLLKEIPDPPRKIFVLGNLPGQESIKIALVGTRKATEAGKTVAKEIARELASLGIVIVSGLAMGIDTAAHEGALESNGLTIAVLANGLDKIYPAQNENLAKNIILSNGALITEYPENTPSFPSQFLERNRIISGLCHAVIIIEAPERSGSLATARFAAEQGREVLVFPGPINNENYKGSHKLIRDGARLVASFKDILEDLNIGTSNVPNIDGIDLRTSDVRKIKDADQLLIFKAIQEAGQPLPVDKIIILSKLEPQTVNQSIAMMVLAGLLKETERGYVI